MIVEYDIGIIPWLHVLCTYVATNIILSVIKSTHYAFLFVGTISGETMTTIVSFASRDCIVCGCDSLGTVQRPMIDPGRLFRHAFDQSGVLKVDQDGKPIIKDFADMMQHVESIPYNQLPNMIKLTPVMG